METSSIKSTSELKLTVTLTLSEDEARALCAIPCYGTKQFLEVYYKNLGKTYLEPYEAGVYSLFKLLTSELPRHIDRFDVYKKKLVE